MMAGWNDLKAKRGVKALLYVFMIVPLVCILSACEDSCDVGSVQADAKYCWSCPIFELLFNTATTIYTQVQSAAVPGACNVIGVGLALWLALRIMRQVASLKELSIYSFWSDLGVRVFWAAMCAALILNMNQITQDLIFPVWSGFIDFGIMVVGKMPAEGGGISCGTGDPATGMSCLVRAIHSKFAEGREMGYILMMCGSESPMLILYGAGIYATSLILGMLFPIFMLDCVFNFAIVMALMPLWVCAFCFPISRALASKAWSRFIAVCMQGAGMAIFSSLCVWCLQAFIAHKFPTIKNAMALASDTATAEKVSNGPGIVIFIYIAFFLLLFGKVLMKLFMMNFCSVEPSGSAQASANYVKNTTKNLGRLAMSAKNIGQKGRDKKMMREYEKMRQNQQNLQKNGKKGMEKDQAKKFAKLENKLMKKGYLEKDKNGNVNTTKAYARAITNSKRRDFARSVYTALGGKGDRFKDWSEGYDSKFTI